MKDQAYSKFICRRFCKYYKPDRDEIQCSGYAFLRNNLTPSELEYLVNPIKDIGQVDKIPPTNKELVELICLKCDFFIDGCDFTDNRSGPPCGGYILIKLLLD